jgi:hypothetical protein
MQPVSVQQMLSKQISVWGKKKQNNWSILAETLEILILRGIFQATHSVGGEKS